LTLGVGRAGVVMNGLQTGIRGDDERGRRYVNELQSAAAGGAVRLTYRRLWSRWARRY